MRRRSVHSRLAISHSSSPGSIFQWCSRASVRALRDGEASSISSTEMDDCPCFETTAFASVASTTPPGAFARARRARRSRSAAVAASRSAATIATAMITAAGEPSLDKAADAPVVTGGGGEGAAEGGGETVATPSVKVGAARTLVVTLLAARAD